MTSTAEQIYGNRWRNLAKREGHRKALPHFRGAFTDEDHELRVLSELDGNWRSRRDAFGTSGSKRCIEAVDRLLASGKIQRREVPTGYGGNEEHQYRLAQSEGVE